jgi:hypothetical protein
MTSVMLQADDRFRSVHAFGTHGIAETSFIIDSCIFSYGDRLTVTVPFHSPTKKSN